MTTQKDIAVIGAGSYGTSLAISVARNGYKTSLWGHEIDHIARLEADRENKAFLPNIPFP